MVNYIFFYSDEFMKECIMGTDPQIRTFIEEENRKYIDKVKKLFGDARKKGEIRQDIKIEFVMHMFNMMKEIFKDDDLTKLYPDTASFIKDIFNFFYYGVLSRENS